MDRTPQDHRRVGTDDVRGNFDTSVQHTDLPSSLPHTDNVPFFDSLLQGLDNLPSMGMATDGRSAESGFRSPWNNVTHEPDLSSFQSPNYGDWTSYPTDTENGASHFSADSFSGLSASPGYVSNDDCFQSLSQPDPAINTDNVIFTSRNRSHSEHYTLGGIASPDFTSLIRNGHDTSAESFDQWHRGRVCVSDSGVYDPFVTAHMLQQQVYDSPNPSLVLGASAATTGTKIASPIHTEHGSLSALHDDVCDSSTKNKLSYSEVAKNRPDQKCISKKTDPFVQNNQQDMKGSSDLPKPFPDFTGIKPKNKHLHHSHGYPRSNKFHGGKHKSTLQPTNIRPDSRYGLDTFEEPVLASKSGCSDHLSVSSGSAPQSRKGSASSGTDSYCGLEDIDHISSVKRSNTTDECVNDYGNRIAQPWVGLKYNPKTGLYQNIQDPMSDNFEGTACGDKTTVHNVSSGLDDGKTKCQVPSTDNEDCKGTCNLSGHTSTNSSSTGKSPISNSNSSKEHIYFDPRRIFSPNAHTQQSRPVHINHPHQQREKSNARTTTTVQPEDILNNDKPKTRQNNNINRSCYISNNLHEIPVSSQKKQTNADNQNDPTIGPSHSKTSGPRAASQIGGSGTRSHSTRNVTSNSAKKCSAGSHMNKHAAFRRHRLDTRTTAPDQSALPQQDIHHPQGPKEDIPHKIKKTQNQSSWYQQDFGDLPVLMWKWTLWATQELGVILWNITKLTISIGLALLLMGAECLFSVVKSMWVVIRSKIKHEPKIDNKQPSPCGVKENITLPSTGNEAMKRLLAGKGKDPYSILGVRSDASDDVIKKYYRRQAVLVHPDKNQMPGAEEAFKILGHAFDLIGEPEKRKQFDSKRLETQEEEEALHRFADLLSKLNEKMQEASNFMRCTNCGGKHKRVPTERPMYAARYCQKCDYSHPVREGDVWAESHMLGFLWNYYACMENRVYDITEWSSCQVDHLKHIQANAHQIVYRIATNSGGGRHRQQNTRSNEADLEDFLNHLFHQSGGSGAGPESASQAGYQGASAWNQSTSSTTNTASKKSRRRKKKH